MCHPGLTFVGLKISAVHGRWLALPAAHGVVETVRGHASRVAAREAAAGGGNRTNQEALIKRCLCSPTQHPGSFRCRQHHAEYVWGGRMGRGSTN
ncbi:Ly-6/neurotoxin-like protein [Quillaja saponaria]|uniref:Ly-6/neurotoxin-like protein n=1 Tax=Quillaja saponaria TaxID=32244 RepID=A0AAD7M6F8_QUISA|nr:Ly-6/neurotoxin-like protein [Quillaja saponaria]